MLNASFSVFSRGQKEISRIVERYQEPLDLLKTMDSSSDSDGASSDSSKSSGTQVTTGSSGNIISQTCKKLYKIKFKSQDNELKSAQIFDTKKGLEQYKILILFDLLWGNMKNRFLAKK